MKWKSIIVRDEEVLFLDNQLQSPLELFEDNFFITVRMILTWNFKNTIILSNS